jgi:amino acid transporter
VGLLFASLAIMLSVFGSMNGNVLVGPRLLYAMGQDGLAPRVLSRLHPKYNTPALAITVLAGWCILEVVSVTVLLQNPLPVVRMAGWEIDFNLPQKSPFDFITDFAMFGALSFETLAVASIFVFRRRFPPTQLTLPYRCPFYPVVPLVYVSCLSLVLVNMFRTQRAEALTGICFILVGAVLYALFLRAPRSRSTAP